jgi:hypothetical protein
MSLTQSDDVNSNYLEATLSKYAPKIWEGRARHPQQFERFVDLIATASRQAPDHEWVRCMRAANPTDIFRPEKGYTPKMAEVYYLVHCYMR